MIKVYDLFFFSVIFLNFRNFDKPGGKISLLGDGSHFWTSPFSRTPPHHVDWISRRDETMELEPMNHNGSKAFLELYLKIFLFKKALEISYSEKFWNYRLKCDFMRVLASLIVPWCYLLKSVHFLKEHSCAILSSFKIMIIFNNT